MKLCNTAAFATLFLAGTTSASLRGAIDTTKNKLHPGRQRQFNLDIACDADVQECNDGSFVSRDPANGCEFPACPDEGIVCTEDVQECSDGSFVSRDPTNDCKFPSCPNEDIFCAADIQECDDGSFVSRDPTNNCEFPACPNEDIVCAADVQECSDGSFVSRDPANNCEFPSCGTLSAKPPPPPPVDTTFRFNVRPQEFSPSVMDGYTDCEDLKSHIIVALKAAADKKISDGMGTSCTWYDDYPNGPDDYASAPDMVGADMESKPSTGGNGFNNRDNGDGVNSFDTNNQVDGVDEADLVKANGKHVFLSYSNQIIVTDTNGQILLRQDIPQPKKPENKDVYQDERTIQGMLLSEDNILSVVTQFYNHTEDYSPLGNAVTTTFVYQFDEKDNLLVLKEEFDTSGSYSTARMINGTSYLITNSNMDTYNFTGELYRCDEKFRGLSDEEYEAQAFGVASSTVESFASKIMDALDFTNSQSCENIVQIFDQNPTETDSLPDMWFIYNNGVLNTFSHITSFQTSEVEDSSEFERSYAGIFLPTSSWDTQTYASENLLVLSGGGYRLANVTDEENRDCQVTYEYTFLVTFDLDGEQNGATLGAAGAVEGSIVNGNLGQFSMDYFDDHLRVATSFSARYGFCPLEDGDRLWKRLDPARSQVSVLQGQDGNLKQVGVTDDLGGDGTIASVRFLGDKGYVSSWQNKDPLYVLDLSDPSTPRKTAELNVTDSLNYLHPLSNGKKLLTVGSASSSMDDADNYIRGLKISLFNVEDSSNPYEEESYVFETIGYSKALSDHHAFRYIPQNGLLSIPGSEESWKDKKYFDGAWLFHIDPDNAVISKFDNVRHAGVDEMTGWYCWNPSQLPSRSMMFNSNLLTMLSHSIALTSNDGDTTTTNIVNLDEGRTETKNDDCSQYRGYRYGW